MKKPVTIKSIAACSLFYWATTVLAHDVHGLADAHWHATDTLGFVVVACLAAVAVWISRK